MIDFHRLRYPILSAILFAFFYLNAPRTQAQSRIVSFADSVTGLTVYLGAMTWEQLQAQPGSEWLQKGESAYQPDAAALAFLQKNLNSVSMLVFLGTWCDDSRFLIPRLVKTLKLSNYPLERAQVFGVDRNKQTLGDESRKYNIIKAPTIVLIKDDKELGRIVETVPVSVEKSLEEILRKAGSSK